MTKTNAGLVIVAAMFIGAWVGGCEEDAAPDVKANRLISAENRQLKTEIGNLKIQIEQQKQQLNRCEEEKKVWEYKAGKGLEESSTKTMEMLMSADKERSDEIERLKAEVAKLKGEKPSKSKAVEEKPQAVEEAPPVSPPEQAAGEEKHEADENTPVPPPSASPQ